MDGFYRAARQARAVEKLASLDPKCEEAAALRRKVGLLEAELWIRVERLSRSRP